MSKDDLMKKWAPLLDSMGVTASHWGNMAQLAENQSQQILEENTTPSETTDEFPSLLPMAMKVASKTVGLDLVSVQPMANPGMSQDEIDRINNEIKKENRDGKIDALIEGKDYKEMKPEDHPDWRPVPKGHLFYMDFKYGHKKTRRSGKRNKKK